MGRRRPKVLSDSQKIPECEQQISPAESPPLTPDNRKLSWVDGASEGIEPATEGELAAIEEKVAGYVRASRSQATRRAYASDWRRFARWCEGQGASALPAAPEAVAAYLAAHASSLRASTLQRHLASISVAHQAAGYESPSRNIAVRTVLAGIRREHGTAPDKKRALSIGELEALVEACGDELVGLRDRALILVGFATALRRSELARLVIEDLEEVQQGFILKVGRSKTDQEGVGRELAIGYGDPAKRTCPVLALRRWIDGADISAGPIWLCIDRWGNPRGQAMSGSAIAEVVKRRAAAIGLDPDRLGGHSLRAGFATAAAAAGVGEGEIAEVTGHRSIQVLRGYVRRGKLFGAEISRRVGL